MKIGFIGLGNMASAIIRGIAGSGMEGVSIYGYNPHAEKTQALAASCGLVGCESNTAVVRASEIVVLAVKPQVIASVLPELAPDAAGKLFVSVVAGKSLDWLAERLPGAAIIRAMPNINAKIGASVTGWCASASVSDAQKTAAEQILQTIGTTVEVPEKFAGIVSAVGGASPAYTYLYINALAEAALRAGMPKKMALELAAASCEGSARMVRLSGEHPWALADQVTSPGGTTVEGLLQLQTLGFEHAVHAAIDAVLEKDARL